MRPSPCQSLCPSASMSPTRYLIRGTARLDYRAAGGCMIGRMDTDYEDIPVQHLERRLESLRLAARSFLDTASNWEDPSPEAQDAVRHAETVEALCSRLLSSHNRMASAEQLRVLAGLGLDAAEHVEEQRRAALLMLDPGEAIIQYYYSARVLRPVARSLLTRRRRRTAAVVTAIGLLLALLGVLTQVPMQERDSAVRDAKSDAVVASNERVVQSNEQVVRSNEQVMLVVTTAQLKDGKLAHAISSVTTESESAYARTDGSVNATILLIDGTMSMTRYPVRSAVRAYLRERPLDGPASVLTFGKRGATAFPLGKYSESEILRRVDAIPFTGQYTDTVSGIRYAVDAAAALGDGTRIVLFTDGRNDPAPDGADSASLRPSDYARTELVMLGDVESPFPNEDVRFKAAWQFSKERGLIAFP